MLSFHLRLLFPNGLSLLGFPAEMFYVFITCSVRVTCSDNICPSLAYSNNNNNNNVTANMPHIIIKNKKEKACKLIGVTIPADRNVVQKEEEKKLKYKSLCIEIQRMWNLKCTIIPVIIGATRIVTRSLRKNLEAIPGKHSIDSLQKAAILGTSHIIRKVLQCEA